jgi:hypothetical protein
MPHLLPQDLLQDGGVGGMKYVQNIRGKGPRELSSPRGCGTSPAGTNVLTSDDPERIAPHGGRPYHDTLELVAVDGRPLLGLVARELGGKASANPGAPHRANIWTRTNRGACHEDWAFFMPSNHCAPGCQVRRTNKLDVACLLFQSEMR